MIDLEGYFGRIGYDGATAPDGDTLAAILRLHPQAIAFENLDPLLGVPVRLDAAAIEQKLVRSGRGGYCYEQNLLLMHVLRALGFRVRALAARSLRGAAEGAIMPRGHMLLGVDLGGTLHIADVGFGGGTPTGPLRLDRDCAQPTPHGPFRLARDGGDFLLQTETGQSWQSLYRFDLQEQLQVDYEMANWYKSTHPKSLFTTSLMVARTAPGRRYGLYNSELSVRHADGPSERRVLRTAAELRGVLSDTFGLTLADATGLDALLTRFTAVAA